MALGADPQSDHPPLVRRAAAGADAGLDADAIANIHINPTGELPAPLPMPAAGAALNALDGYQPTPTDQRDMESTFTQLKGQFLIDRDGVVRWAHIECGKMASPVSASSLRTTN